MPHGDLPGQPQPPRGPKPVTQAPCHRGLGPWGRASLALQTSPWLRGQQQQSHAVTGSLCTPGTSGHTVRATLLQPGTGASPALHKGAAGERPLCVLHASSRLALARMPGGVTVTAAPGPGALAPVCRAEQAG